MVNTIENTLMVVNMFFARMWHTGLVTNLPIVCCGPGVEPTIGDGEAERLVIALKALADPIRLRLVNIISQQGEACACDLPEALDRSQPTISHHLKVLVEAGLLDREQRGKWAWFTIRVDALRSLSEALNPAAIDA